MELDINESITKRNPNYHFVKPYQWNQFVKTVFYVIYALCHKKVSSVSYYHDWRQFRVELEYSGNHKKLLENINSVFSSKNS